MTFTDGEGYCLFDALAPSADQEFDYGVVVTYSLDLVALAGLAATLSGYSDNLKTLSAVETIRALDKMKGRLTVCCQRGRIAVPRGAPSIIAQFERFIDEQHYKEQYGSWHPKAILAAYRAKHQRGTDREWRLWIGSRNLTATDDLEAGLLLVGRSIDKHQRPPIGASEFFDFLLSRVWKRKTQRARLVSELTNKVRWRAPEGVSIEAFHFWTGGSKRGTTTIDFAPFDATDALVISPFVDTNGFKAAAKLVKLNSKKGSRRVLLTTADQLQEASLRKLAKDSDFDLKVFIPPTIDLGADGLTASEITAPTADGFDGEPAEEEQGLHSKIYLFRGLKGEKAILFLGSANATGRALTGRNCEVLARLRVNDEIAESLFSFAARCDDWQEQPADPAAALANSLREDRNILASALKSKLHIDADGTFILRGTLPKLKTEDVVVSVALITRLQFPVPWPSSASEVEIAKELPQSEWTDLICFELSIPGDDALRTSWVQRIDAPALTEEVRRKCASAAIIRYLTPEELLALAKAELTNLPVTTNRGWTEKPPPRRGSSARHRLDAPMSLEDILNARLRNPDQSSTEIAVRMRDRILGAKSLMMKESPEEYELLAPMYETLERVWHALVEK